MRALAVNGLMNLTICAVPSFCSDLDKNSFLVLTIYLVSFFIKRGVLLMVVMAKKFHILLKLFFIHFNDQ